MPMATLAHIQQYVLYILSSLKSTRLFKRSPNIDCILAIVRIDWHIHAATHQRTHFFHQLQGVQVVLTGLVDPVDLRSPFLPPFQVNLWLPSHPLAQETPSRLCLPFSLQIQAVQHNAVPIVSSYFNVMHFITKVIYKHQDFPTLLCTTQL